MPATAARTLTFTPDEYIAWEPSQEVRHEYHFGEVFPMSGGTSAHAELIVSLTAALYDALRGSECRVRSEAMRVQVSDDQYVYPDLTVTRGEAAFRSASRTTLLNPVLVVEVLSPATRAYDVGEKFELYRSMPSVEEVLFVDSERRRVETARRTDEGWALSGPADAGAVRLASVDVEVDVDALYEGVR